MPVHNASILTVLKYSHHRHAAQRATPHLRSTIIGDELRMVTKCTLLLLSTGSVGSCLTDRLSLQCAPERMTTTVVCTRAV